MTFEPKANEFIKRLENAGFEAYFVGGCVRDAVMGLSPQDIDIASCALPQETARVFSDCRVVPTGLKHGTQTVILGEASAEITTYRKESGYSDGRRPDFVEFSNRLEDDLMRRDFTMNALCYNESRGLVDLFGGIDDIKNGIIRCIGDPERRFDEDSLRILRAVRFASKLGFEIEERTKEAMYACRSNMKNLSAERVYSELVGILCGKYAGKTIIEYFDFISFVLPETAAMKGFEQHNFHHIYDVLEHTAKVVDSVEPLPHLRLAAFLHDSAKPDCFSLDENGVGHFYSHASLGADKTAGILKRLKADGDTCRRAEKLVRIHDSPIEAEKSAVKRKLSRLGEEMFFDLVKLQRADNLGLSPEFFSRQKHYDELIRLSKEIIAENQCFSLRSLAVDGNDMLSLGLFGREVGEALDFLLCAVMDGRAENSKSSLLNYLKRHKYGEI